MSIPVIEPNMITNGVSNMKKLNAPRMIPIATTVMFL